LDELRVILNILTPEPTANEIEELRNDIGRAIEEGPIRARGSRKRL
jgi:hypothetical protein